MIDMEEKDRVISSELKIGDVFFERKYMYGTYLGLSGFKVSGITKTLVKTEQGKTIKRRDIDSSFGSYLNPTPSLLEEWKVQCHRNRVSKWISDMDLLKLSNEELYSLHNVLENINK